MYFFTVEFGLCRQQDGSFRVYGAGLLSSVAELQHALATPDKIKRFDPEVTVNEECIITSYQNAYYYTDSFEEAKEKMRAFAESIQRPFGVRYNPYTQSVEVLSNAQKITALVRELRGDICIVSSAIKKISAKDSTLDVETIATMLHTGLGLKCNKLNLKMYQSYEMGSLRLNAVSDRSPQSFSESNSPNSDRSVSPRPEATK
ncbi:Tryptophan 5-hydroxylase [Eumeta japonica]|uniref:Tryptophan 5-hydroxylase n=1 Tax=Eumeta variegata TaxID=151549 RepID=A0A4C1SJ87_EUMVA|nr:Tryptophan 5-hydroxylase [Eumeta japonica]